MNGISNMYGFYIKSMGFLKCLGLIARQEEGKHEEEMGYCPLGCSWQQSKEEKKE